MTRKEPSGARLPGFYKLSIPERLEELRRRGLLNEDDHKLLLEGRQALPAEAADHMSENVIGTFGLPLGLGLNFLINDKEYVVPLVVEEPSVVAAVSSAAKMARDGGGFRAQCDSSLLIGQIQIVDVTHSVRARAALLHNAREIIDLANSLHARLVARGGGAREVEVIIHPVLTRQRDMIVVHLLVDTKDAMGANLVNTMCEGVAPLVEKISGGRVFLRILSNLTDRSMVRAEVTIPCASLEAKGFAGEAVRDGIILAADFAAVDPYRAATHNKGVMNGIDGVALATGNDWRAIEAAAHAYAGRGSRYTSLTRWNQDKVGNLVGQIDLPLKVGIVGGSVALNPAVGVSLRLLGVESAPELAQVMAAVGLAQNFAALRALSTEGIQRGHMNLHARSCAVAAGSPPDLIEAVVERLVQSGDIKTWKAKEIVMELQRQPSPGGAAAGPATTAEARGAGHGKVILLGEHAVVYGSHALAAPIPRAVEARVRAPDRGDTTGGVRIVIPRWGVEQALPGGERPPPPSGSQDSLHNSLDMILRELELRDRAMVVEVFPHIPRAAGLGSSAAVAVAIVRALARFAGATLSDDEVNKLAFESEKLAHGTPSGIDNTMATFGRFIVFRRGEPAVMRDVKVPRPIPIVIGQSGVASLTVKTVAMVRESFESNRTLYQRVFDDIDRLTLEAVEAVEAFDLVRLGQMMNVNHGLLNGLRLSCWELEELISIARANGALGAKLTGGGGGGSMVALCPADAPEVQRAVADAMRAKGYDAMATEIG